MLRFRSGPIGLSAYAFIHLSVQSRNMFYHLSINSVDLLQSCLYIFLLGHMNCAVYTHLVISRVKFIKTNIMNFDK